MEGLRCIDDFTVRCLDREHRAYFNTLYAGTTQVIVDLCQEGAYQSGPINLHKYRLLYRKHLMCILLIINCFLFRLFAPCSLYATSSKWV